MNDTDSKKLEEIEAAVGLNYCFTSDNWSGKQARSPQQDERWLILTVKEQDREIERLRDMYQVHLKAREKAEAELSVINGLLARRAAIDDYEFAYEKIQHMLGTIKEQDQALADCKAVYEAHATEAEKQIDELQGELAEIREECPCVRMQEHFNDTSKGAVQFTVCQLHDTSAELSACKERARETADEIHFLKMGIEADDPKKELILRCVDIRKKALQAQEQSKEPKS